MILALLVMMCPAACSDAGLTGPADPQYVVANASAIPIDLVSPDSTPDDSLTADSAPESPTQPSGVIDFQSGKRAVAEAASLPRVFLSFSFPAVSGRSLKVDSDDNLQRALNRAERGDEIVLAAGATFTGNFILPKKSGTVADGWVLVRSERLGQLPALGSRVSPAHDVYMARLVSPNAAPALKTEAGASGWWLAGLEITVAPINDTNYGLVMLGEQGRPQTSLTSVPSDLVLDRLYIHGLSSSSVQRCVSLNSARTQVSDSYIVECHGKGFDTQAIWGGNGPGPYKIVNNMLQGAGENLMFGGSDPAIPGLVPSDIEIRRNYLHTPLAWKSVWTKKNLLEIKNGARVLVEGNVMDGSWLDGQTGWAVVLKSENQSGSCTWCRTTDITIRRNLIRNVSAGIGIGPRGDNPHTDTTARRINVLENVLEDVGRQPGDKRGFSVYGGVADVTLERNVLSGDLQAALILDPQFGGARRTVLRDNVWAYGSYGVIASGFGGGSTALRKGAPGYVWANMTFIGPAQSGNEKGTLWVSAERNAPLASRVRSQVAAATAGVDIPD